MRTTVEIRDEQRAELLRLAAERGEKGFSGIVQEALELYLEAQAKKNKRIREALAVLGTMNEAGALALEESVTTLRRRWR